MTDTPPNRYEQVLESIRADGLFKSERIITSPQDRADRPRGRPRGAQLLRQQLPGPGRRPRRDRRGQGGARHARLRHGLGALHLRHAGPAQAARGEDRGFFGTEDAILYAACFDANGGLFEPLLGEEDAVISDALNHASIIDGVRLCKAKRYRYANCDMADLEAQLKQARADGVRDILVTSDGVFSMDGFIAPLDRDHRAGGKYGALVHIDECHATGFIGATGRGSAERAACSTGSTSSPARWARRWAARSAVSPPAGARCRAAAPALAALPVLQLAAAARGGRRASACSTCWPRRATCAEAGETPPTSASG
jgi:glycine C-acetyltransferase